MPFLDGLQLCKIVRDRMPATKLVILTGHDEFDYAQQAIQLGVTEYLLKAVTVHQLHQVLQRLALQLDRERDEQAALERLRQQGEESRAPLVERLWFKLLVSAISLPEAIEQSQLLGLDLLARCYLVVVIRIAARDAAAKFDYAEYQRAQDIVSGIVSGDPDISVLRKDLEELVLIIRLRLSRRSTRGGFQAMVDGWFQADVECDPLLGPQVFDIAAKLVNGQPVDRNILTNETVYYPDKAAELLPTRQY